jgi:hypothetical protein
MVVILILLATLLYISSSSYLRDAPLGGQSTATREQKLA